MFDQDYNSIEHEQEMTMNPLTNAESSAKVERKDDYILTATSDTPDSTDTLENIGDFVEPPFKEIL